MSKGYVDGFDRKKQLSKKKKALLKKNTLTLGFDPGFTLFYLRPSNTLSSIEKNKIKLVLTEEETRTRTRVSKKKKTIASKKKVEKKKTNKS